MAKMLCTDFEAYQELLPGRSKVQIKAFYYGHISRKQKQQDRPVPKIKEPINIGIPKEVVFDLKESVYEEETENVYTQAKEEAEGFQLFELWENTEYE